jgi:UDP-N-acetyl-2-amino-2-deoxyglucuronate dehydrogenase
MGNTNRKIRVGIIGCGFIGRFHSFMLFQAERLGHLAFERALAYDADPKRTEEFERWGWRAAKSLDELLEGVDAVWVCVPTAYHLEIVERAAEAGVAGIFCEKPLGRDLEEAQKVRAAAGDVPTQVGLVLRTAPPFRVAKALVESGRLGKLQTVMFRDDQYVPVMGQYRSTWRKDPEIAGSGVLLEHSIHDVDLIDWIAGPVQWVSGEVRSQIEIADGIEDLAVAALGTASESVSTLTTVWHNVKTRPSNRHVEIFGSEGVVTIHNEVIGPVEIEAEGRKEILQGNALIERFFEIEPPWFGESDPLVYAANEDAHFLRALIEGKRPSPDFDIALRAHQLVASVYTSSKADGRKVFVDGDGHLGASGG